MKQLLCVDNAGYRWLTTGKVYDVVGDNDYTYIISDDGNNRIGVYKSILTRTGYYYLAEFKLVEEQSDVADEYEEEEWKRIETNITEKDRSNASFAQQLNNVQKYLKQVGSNYEVMVSKDSISVFDENGEELRGNTDEIIKLIEVEVNLTKLKEKMRVDE